MKEQIILVAGATSAIARAACRHFAADGARFFLVGRRTEQLQTVQQDLQAAGAPAVETMVADMQDRTNHQAVLEACGQRLGEPDLVLVAWGLLGDQGAGEADFAVAENSLDCNFLSVAAFLTPVANTMARRGAGTIAVITSVAGDKGRMSNYIYGAGKGALILWLQGLRNRLFHQGVHVVDIRPGFVDTPMTTAHKKNALFASADQVGRGIHRAVRRRKDVVYLPFFWRGLMLIIRAMPELVFKRLKL